VTFGIIAKGLIIESKSNTSEIIENIKNETLRYLFKIKNTILPIRAGRKLENIIGSTVSGIPLTKISSVKNPIALKK
jgi:hypothetical protein